MGDHPRVEGLPGDKRSHPEAVPGLIPPLKRSRLDPSISSYHWEQLQRSVNARHFLVTTVCLRSQFINSVEVFDNAMPAALCATSIG